MAEMRSEAHEIIRGLLADDIREIKLLQEHLHDGIGQLVYDRTRRRPMILPVVVEVDVIARARWAEAIAGHAVESAPPAADRTAAAVEAAALAFCRLLERWARGEAEPSTAGRRVAALRHAADRVETALAGLERPLGRYLLELEADIAEGRSWFGDPGRGELVDWQPVSSAPASRLRRIGRRRIPRAGRARARTRRACSSRPVAIEPRPRLALGRPVRPPREPARPALDDLRALACCVTVELTVVGSINLDLAVRLDRLPRPGETVTAREFTRFPAARARTRPSPRLGWVPR